MSISLTFDAQAMYNDLMDELLKAMNDLINEFYKEATSGLDADGKADSEIIKASISDTTEHDSYMPLGDVPEYITAKCKFYANALMQSFGTGNFADKSSESYWSEYSKMNTKKHGYIFNPKRKPSSWISGRPYGKYTNIFGEEQKSTGQNAGSNLETLHIKDKNGNYIQITPIYPTRSIQNAERWVIKDGETKIERRIEMVVTKFLTERASDYFREVNV